MALAPFPTVCIARSMGDSFIEVSVGAVVLQLDAVVRRVILPVVALVVRFVVTGHESHFQRRLVRLHFELKLLELDQGLGLAVEFVDEEAS